MIKGLNSVLLEVEMEEMVGELCEVVVLETKMEFSWFCLAGSAVTF